MTRLDTQSAERLTKFLGMLGSAHDGERAAAGLKANQLLRDLGLTWSDIIIPTDPGPAEPIGSAPSARSRSGGTDWQRMAEYCRRYPAALNDRERKFIETMLTWRGAPSERQQKWLSDIYSKLCRGGRQ